LFVIQEPKESSMKIGIIGAGAIGATLTRRLAALGHDVSVANSRGPETLKELGAETGATPATVEDAVRDADLVVVTIPLKNVPDLPRGVFDTRAPGAPIIDTNNYYPRQRDGRIEEIENGMTEARWVEQHVGPPSSRYSTTSTPHTSWSSASRRTARDESRSPSPAMIP
jgi:predicted dinucleotide-binding enzyme